MSTFLTKVVETYRADSEAEAKALIEEAKKDGHFVVSKYNSEVKTVKAKGEVIDEYRRVTITKDITSEKEPDIQMKLVYDQPDEVYENAFTDNYEGVINED